MNMTLLMAVAEAVGLDASQGTILHRSHRGYWEVHGRFHNTQGRTIMREVSCVPWEGSPARLPDDTHNGLHYVPALKGVEDPDRALEVIAAHMRVVVAETPLVGTINASEVTIVDTITGTVEM